MTPPPEGGDELVVGRRAVGELLRSGRPVHRLYVAQGARDVQELVVLAKQSGVPVQMVPREWFERRCRGLAHQGVAAITAAAAYRDFDELLKAVQAEPGPVRVLVLDHIQDPQNLGSLLRTAEGLGARGVVVAARRAAGLTAAVWKASAGAAAYVPVARVASVAAAVERLKVAGLWVVGAHPEGGQVLWESRLPDRVALVVGAEGEGLSALVRRRCDLLVRIPMAGKVASLNAAVAGALLLYEAVRQASGNPGGPAGGSQAGARAGGGQARADRSQEGAKARYDAIS